MANHGSQDLSVLLWGGFDLRPNTNAMPTFGKSAVWEDTTPFGVQDQVQTYAGKRMGSWEIKGFYDSAALASDAALIAGLGAAVPLCVALAGNTLGQPFVGGTGGGLNYDRQAAVGKVTYVDAKLTATGEIDEGLIQQPQGAVSTSGSSTSIDNGASSSNGLVAYLQVPALTLGSATAFTVKMQDSADNSSWADITGGGFTALSASITTAPVAQRLVISGTIRRYTRATWTWTGSTSGASATIFVGIFRGNTISGPVSLVEPTRKDRRTVLDDDASVLTVGGDVVASGDDATVADAQKSARAARSSDKE